MSRLSIEDLTRILSVDKNLDSYMSSTIEQEEQDEEGTGNNSDNSGV